MIFYINREKYDTNDPSIKLISNSGTEGNVYRVGDKAAKIYRELCFKDRLGPLSIDIMSEIKTERILMPQEKIYDENRRFNGYTTKYINNGNLSFDSMTIKFLLEELKKYEKDIEILGSNNITVADMSIFNLVLSDGIYMVDPGSHELSEFSRYRVDYYNKEELRRLFIEQILGINYKSKMIIERINEYFEKNEKLSSLVESYIDDENDTIETYTRKLINKR